MRRWLCYVAAGSPLGSGCDRYCEAPPTHGQPSTYWRRCQQPVQANEDAGRGEGDGGDDGDGGGEEDGRDVGEGRGSRGSKVKEVFVSPSVIVPPRSLPVAPTLTHYIPPGGHPGCPKACDCPSCRWTAPKLSKQSMGSQNKARAGVCAPRRPTREPQTGGGTVSGARSAARLAPRAIRPEKPQRRVSRRQSSGRISPVGQQVLSLPLVHGEIVPAC